MRRIQNGKNDPAAAATVLPTDNLVTRLYRSMDEEDLWPDRHVPSPPLTNNPVEVSAEDAWLRVYMHIYGRDIDPSASLPPGAHRNTSPEMPSPVDGTVRMDLLVDEQGRITRKVPLSGDAEHIEIADEITERWRFHPWVFGEKPVAFHTVITIHFRKSLFGPAGGFIGMAGMATPPTLTARSRTGGAEPVYPAVAKAARVQGIVLLKVTIDENGFVQDASVVSGPPLLQKSALDIVRTWTFQPFLKDGKPTQKIANVQIEFKIP